MGALFMALDTFLAFMEDVFIAFIEDFFMAFMEDIFFAAPFATFMEEVFMTPFILLVFIAAVFGAIFEFV